MDRLTVKEAAAYLRLSPFTLRGWISQKKIPHIKLSRRVFLRKDDLDKLLDGAFVPASDRREVGR